VRKYTAKVSVEMSGISSIEYDGAFYARFIRDCLGRAFGDRRNARKIIARGVNADERAVKAWMSGECGPRGMELIKLMAECSELRAEVDRLIEQLQGNP